eukprot:scaffold5975_cov64-Cyclotella_meneghiniana.AAC.10
MTHLKQTQKGRDQCQSCILTRLDVGSPFTIGVQVLKINNAKDAQSIDIPGIHRIVPLEQTS